MNLRDAIKDDFLEITDDLETVQLWTRSNGQPAVTCPNAKRSLQRDLRQAVESFGFAVSDFVTFQIASTDLGPKRVPMLGDWLTDAAQRRYAIVSVFHGRMTERYRLKCVSLQEVLGSLVHLTVRLQNKRAGSPSEVRVVKTSNIPARIWAVDQTGDDYLGDDLRPRHRCAFFTDGRQLSLPIPQHAGIRDEHGADYEILGVRELDRLAGFAIADLVKINDRKAS